MINSIADKVFVITTVDSNRTNYIKNHLNENNIKFDFFVAPEKLIVTDNIIVKDGGDVSSKNHKASISLTSAYTSIVEVSRINNFTNICVIEDDCFFTKNWIQKIDIFLKNIPNDWDVLNLGYHPLHDTDTIKQMYNDYVNIPLNWHHTAHCMMLKNTCFNEFLNLINIWKYTIPVDYIFNEIYKNKRFKCFFPSGKIIHQLSVRDHRYDIENINLRFKSFVYDT